MTYNNNNLAIGKVAAKTRIHPELACVAFYGDRTVATDSFMLIEMSAQGERRDEPLLAFADQLKGIKLKKCEKIGEKDIPLIHTDNAYPNIEPVLKHFDGRDYAEVKINAEYLERVCSVLKKLNNFQQVTLRVPVGDLNRPVVLIAESRGPEKQMAWAMVMPISR